MPIDPEEGVCPSLLVAVDRDGDGVREYCIARKRPEGAIDPLVPTTTTAPEGSTTVPDGSSTTAPSTTTTATPTTTAAPTTTATPTTTAAPATTAAP